jgi:hypothetical protein
MLLDQRRFQDALIELKALPESIRSLRLELQSAAAGEKLGADAAADCPARAPRRIRCAQPHSCAATRRPKT